MNTQNSLSHCCSHNRGKFLEYSPPSDAMNLFLDKSIAEQLLGKLIAYDKCVYFLWAQNFSGSEHLLCVCVVGIWNSTSQHKCSTPWREEVPVPSSHIHCGRQFPSTAIRFPLPRKDLALLVPGRNCGTKQGNIPSTLDGVNSIDVSAT